MGVFPSPESTQTLSVVDKSRLNASPEVAVAARSQVGVASKASMLTTVTSSVLSESSVGVPAGFPAVSLTCRRLTDFVPLTGSKVLENEVSPLLIETVSGEAV